MTEQDLLNTVRQMRERGSSPKQIARALGMRPAEVAPLIRQKAAMRQAQNDPADRALVGSWISAGWSAGLGLDGESADWAADDRRADNQQPDAGGLVKVLIARRDRASRVTLCGFLVDVYCLGVKDCVGPLTIGAGSVDAYRRNFFQAFEAPEAEAPLELIQHLIYGAVSYARGLGLDPAGCFGATSPYLGEPDAPNPIRFGLDGQPFYISGPNDDVRAVLARLDRTVGAGNYQSMTHLS